MSRKRHTPEEIINKLRQAEVELSRGLAVPQVCRKLGVTEETYYRWRKEYGGVRTDQAKRLKELERENARLKKLLAEAEVDTALDVLRGHPKGQGAVRVGTVRTGPARVVCRTALGTRRLLSLPAGDPLPSGRSRRIPPGRCSGRSA